MMKVDKDCLLFTIYYSLFTYLLFTFSLNFGHLTQFLSELLL